MSAHLLFLLSFQLYLWPYCGSQNLCGPIVTQNETVAVVVFNVEVVNQRKQHILSLRSPCIPPPPRPPLTFTSAHMDKHTLRTAQFDLQIDLRRLANDGQITDSDKWEKKKHKRAESLASSTLQSWPDLFILPSNGSLICGSQLFLWQQLTNTNKLWLLGVSVFKFIGTNREKKKQQHKRFILRPLQ